MKNHVLRRLLAAAPVAVSLLLVPALQANLLSPAYEAQLESWLGQGDLDFTNIYSKSAGDDTNTMHAAIDGQGATFTLMNIYGRSYRGSFDYDSQIIGGYNPQSWSSINEFNYSPTDADRNAFIFNLTSSVIQRQNLDGQGDPNSGSYQTYNSSSAGIRFGREDISASLVGGYALNYSYGGTSYGDSIVVGGPNYVYSSFFLVGELEVWTYAPTAAAVPDTAGTLGWLSASLLGLAALRRRVA